MNSVDDWPRYSLQGFFQRGDFGHLENWRRTPSVEFMALSMSKSVFVQNLIEKSDHKWPRYRVGMVYAVCMLKWGNRLLSGVKSQN
jgi:hypothetical protein